MTIQGRPIVIQPDFPYEAMTLRGKPGEPSGFVLGAAAFRSDAELTRTLLHETYRLTTSQSAAGVSAELAAQETKDAFSFAQRAWEVFFQ